MQIYTDGGSRGNPGPAAFGFVVKRDGKTIHEKNGYIGIATNNVAEYTALIEALSWLKNNLKDEKPEFFLDSQLVVSQLNGLFKVKNSAIRNLVIKVRILEADLGSITYKYIPRIKNQDADRQVNIALDRHGT